MGNLSENYRPLIVSNSRTFRRSQFQHTTIGEKSAQKFSLKKKKVEERGEIYKQIPLMKVWRGSSSIYVQKSHDCQSEDHHRPTMGGRCFAKELVEFNNGWIEENTSNTSIKNWRTKRSFDSRRINFLQRDPKPLRIPCLLEHIVSIARLSPT